MSKMQNLNGEDRLQVQLWDELPEVARKMWERKLMNMDIPPLVFDTLTLDPSSDDASPKQLAAKLGSDPLLAAKVLAVANSAMMGQVKEVTNLDRAVVQLGLNLIQSIMVSYHMESTMMKLPDFKREHFKYVRRWGAISSLFAFRFANAARHPDAPTIGTAALLARLGALIFAMSKPEPSDEYWGASDEVTRLRHEGRYWQISCAVVSSRLLKLWGLPDPLPGYVAASWEPFVPGYVQQDTPHCRALVLIATATAMASAYLSKPNHTARELLDRQAYAPLKAAVERFKLLDVIIDTHASAHLKHELKILKE